MRRHPYLMNRNGHYYFRIAVPLPLMACLNKKEITYSLKTKTYAEATLRSALLLGAIQDAFRPPYQGLMGLEGEIKNILKQWHTGSPYTINRTVPEQSTDTIFKNPNSADLFQAYLDECPDREKTIQRKRAVFDLWLDVMGNMPVEAIGKIEAREFKSVLLRLPSNMKKRYGNKSVKEINLENIPPEQKLSIPSINYYLILMQGFFTWLINNGLYEQNNPFHRLMLKDPEQRKDKKHPFSKEQLKAIFTAPIYTGSKDSTARGRYEAGSIIIKDGFYWVPLIALYSGARLQEICQLYVTDIRQIEGIWVLDINDSGPDKQLKNTSSTRLVPIHSELIRLGLIEHRNQMEQRGETRLFLDLPLGSNNTYSSVFSKRFNHYLRTQRIKTDKTSFHSLRHTFIDGLRNAGVDRAIAMKLTGHQDQATAHDSYGHGYKVKQLQIEIEKLCWMLAS